jgi:hypothetical protein
VPVGIPEDTAFGTDCYFQIDLLPNVYLSFRLYRSFLDQGPARERWLSVEEGVASLWPRIVPMGRANRPELETLVNSYADVYRVQIHRITELRMRWSMLASFRAILIF